MSCEASQASDRPNNPPEAIEGPQIAALFSRWEVSHVITVPDSTLGMWLEDLQRAKIEVVQVCREGEAWAVAGGLYLGGANPVVMIQCTGLFESGDALRNILHDYRMPLLAVVGYRSYLNQSALPGDTCLTFTEPILDAWRIPYQLIMGKSDLEKIDALFRNCHEHSCAGIAVIAEGRA